jgi:hypothetical protein
VDERERGRFVQKVWSGDSVNLGQGNFAAAFFASAKAGDQELH